MLIHAIFTLSPLAALNRAAERWAGPLVGLFAGMPRGIAGMFGSPLIAYLVDLGLHPDLFVKYIAILFLAATGTLILALVGMGALSIADFAVAAVLLILALGGLDMQRRAAF